MNDKRCIALEALEDGMSMHLVANYVGVPVEQVRVWKEAAKHDGDPIMRLHYSGMAPSQIAHELGIPASEARAHIVSLWKYDKENKKGR